MWWFNCFLFLLSVGYIFSSNFLGLRSEAASLDVAKLTSFHEDEPPSQERAFVNSPSPSLFELENESQNINENSTEKMDPPVTIPQKRISYLLLKARSLLLVNDLEEAHRIVQLILKSDPTNEQAIAIEKHIREANLEINANFLNNKGKTRGLLLKNIHDTWKMPQIIVEEISSPEEEEWGHIFQRLNRITIPRISFNKTPLSQTINTIVTLAEEYDQEQDPQSKGINMVVMVTPGEIEPTVTLNLKNMALDKILSFIAKASAYQFDIEEEVIVFRKTESSASENLETKFFKISRSAIVRMTGIQNTTTGESEKKESSNALVEEERLIKEFLQKAGVNFAVSGSNLAYDGSQLIVTQTLRNMKRVKGILAKYEQVKQVEIETKFIEIQQGKLDELQFKWNMDFNWGKTPEKKRNLSLISNKDGISNLRTLSNAFTIQNASGGGGSIVLSSNEGNGNTTMDIPNSAPSSPGGISLGSSAVDPLSFTGVINDRISLGLALRALEQQSNSDLMSAPKLTVLSGKTAKIVVAQEFIYPKTYGEISSGVGTGDAGSAAVTITAGTPSDFETRNVGVEMNVTPTIEENNCISLQLTPKVTEFEGFIEYGGRSVAIQGNTTVQLPPGFFQPIFSRREIQTEVTIYDGATVVMGGLTREEIKEVNDKIPLLGDIPLIGKLFRSKGETSHKKNLLIFVTANILSPGGTPIRMQKNEQNREPVYRVNQEDF
ncbi:MAG: hypothetical protein LBN94_00375 [Puniceicoccales bacterium]|jgi:general secretion pathway protein D|nr:hypothetical protein [Puniceicoccales bacterium]